MKEALEFILTHIVDHPEEVMIEEQADGDRFTYIIHVHPEDMGKVIGKQGRIIKAVRDLIRVIATRERVYVDVRLAEDDQAPTPVVEA